MNKKTISAILTGIMICLTIAIVVLVIRINNRGPRPIEIADAETSVIISENNINTPVDNSDNETYEPELVATPSLDNSASSVNVRSGPGADYERLGSAYPDCEYVVIEVMPNGWTRIVYDDDEAYISSSYVTYQYRLELGDGTYTYTQVNESVVGYKAKGASEAVIEEKIDENNDGNIEENEDDNINDSQNDNQENLNDSQNNE